MRKQNEHAFDRLFRLYFGSAILVAGYYYNHGIGALIHYLLGGMLILTGAMGFCGLYKLRDIDTRRWFKLRHWHKILIMILLAIWPFFLATIVWASWTHTRQAYLDHLKILNGACRQALALTEKGSHWEAAWALDGLMAAYNDFDAEYRHFRPVAVRFDVQSNDDFLRLDEIIIESKEETEIGDLLLANLKFKEVGQIVQAMQRRGEMMTVFNFPPIF